MSFISRSTKETEIICELLFDSERESDIDTGIPFFDHMLHSFSTHSGIYLNIHCKGDLEVDFHHTVEDCGIVIGQSLLEEINHLIEHNRLNRFSNKQVCMDEALVSCTIDICNRPFFVYNVDIDGQCGNFDVELIEEFFKSFTFNSKINLHLNLLYGKNKHHILELLFKSVALSLKDNFLLESKNISSKGKL